MIRAVGLDLSEREARSHELIASDRTRIEGRFWSRVDLALPSLCWEWQGARDDHGYGRFTIIRGHQDMAHRVAFFLTRGVIGLNLVLDHLCRVRWCVNPCHLDPVTQGENSRRGIAGVVSRRRQLAITHCPKGHAYDDINTGFRLDGRRRCRTCDADRSRDARRLVVAS